MREYYSLPPLYLSHSLAFSLFFSPILSLSLLNSFHPFICLSIYLSNIYSYIHLFYRPQGMKISTYRKTEAIVFSPPIAPYPISANNNDIMDCDSNEGSLKGDQIIIENPFECFYGGVKQFGSEAFTQYLPSSQF